MFKKTLTKLQCIDCQSADLELKPNTATKRTDDDEVSYGEIRCKECDKSSPILAGVALLVDDPEEYIYQHAKGIRRYLDRTFLPKTFHDAYDTALGEIDDSAVQEDLETERVTALYIINHYLKARDFWNPNASPAIGELITKYWDTGPFQIIANYLKKTSPQHHAMIELGCGTGGLGATLSANLNSYLGVDDSFSSIAFARSLYFAKTESVPVSIPQDLINGHLSKTVNIPKPEMKDTDVDFIVSNIENPALQKNRYTLTAALNLIDMLFEPTSLPRLQKDLLRDGGIAVQSSPYIWHENISKELRKEFDSANSAELIEKLYVSAGLKVTKSLPHNPWLFFKHFRQIELYSTHILFAEK